MQRAEVWWAKHPPTQRHPVLLLSWDTDGGWRDQVTVAGITTNVRDLDVEVLLDEDDGMREECAVNLDSLATIRRSLLVAPITTLSPTRMAEVDEAIHRALGIPLPCRIG